MAFEDRAYPTDYVTAIIDPLDGVTTFTRDQLHRETLRSDPNGVSVQTGYDPNSNVAWVQDGNGNKTTFDHDKDNRRIATHLPDGSTTWTGWDPNDNIVSVKDAGGNQTKFAFNALDALETTTDPRGGAASNKYDLAGRLLESTDRNGRRKEFTYDDADRLTQEVWYAAGGSIVDTRSFTLDAAGNVLVASSASGTYTLTYDGADRPVSQQGPFGVALAFGYDGRGQRNLVTDSFGGAMTTLTDAAGRWTSRQFTDGTNELRLDATWTANDELGTLTRYRDLAGQQKVGASAYVHDPGGRVTSLAHQDGAGTWVANCTYTWDLADRLMNETANGQPRGYAYDQTDQLTQVSEDMSE